jgi:hypothetical protein
MKKWLSMMTPGALVWSNGCGWERIEEFDHSNKRGDAQIRAYTGSAVEAKR